MSTPIVTKGIKASLKSRPITSLIQGLVETSEMRRTKFYGSDVGWCPRKAVLSKHVPPTIVSTYTPANKLYMAIGTAVHDSLQDLFKRAEVLVESERYVKHPIGIGGFIDVILWLNGKQVIVELKTCGNLPDKARDGHLHQAATYAFMTGIRDARVLYMSRNVAKYDGSLMTTEFKVNKEIIAQAIRNIAAAEVGQRQGLIPDIPPNITSKSKCRYCPFQKFCWAGGSLTIDSIRKPNRAEARTVKKMVEIKTKTLIKEFLGRIKEIESEEETEK